ncbi:hypothetical protein ACFUC1_03185 [Pedococcus sp. NPDC057267]|uniref:hypothetical protein n=1 Tax=Pedococcus sp. NPDC057267 TaxID=3346077 RepID=UPI00363D2D87
MREHDAAVTTLLDAATSDGVLALHHQRLPGRRAAVAHLAITASGIFVIDARHLQSRCAASQEVGDPTDLPYPADLRVGEAITRVRSQVAALRSALSAIELADVQVEGLVCTGSTRRLDSLRQDDEASGVRVVSLDGLNELLAVQGPLEGPDRATLHEFLTAQMSPAA